MRNISQNYRNFCLKRGTWSADEDQMLRAYIKRYGIWNWNEMPKAAGLLRSGKSCRLRWMNYLRPGIKRGNLSKEEVQTIIKLHEMLGNSNTAVQAPKLQGTSPVNDINENQHMEGNVGSLESFGEPSFWDQPFSMEAQMFKVEDYGETYTDEMWVQELLSYPNASHNFECKQRNSSDIDVSLPTSPNILKSEEYSSNGTLPMSPIISTDNFSSSSSNPVNDFNENQHMVEIGSLESFGELSLWDHPFSMEAQLCKVEDYGETYTDQMWVQELPYY
ncbi:hypothetical protein H0E87_020365 [Populus deltoides]|uniref:Uncharacterized protein n=1 Tax=Populus deltoides TaxID=3696 RepID=A0A8T2XLB1_POPDE|nr:hypothetical protein H0E87_020365 [Populus deltoides]